MKTNFEKTPLLPYADPSRIAEVYYANPQLQPRVSVVVPVYNTESTLEEALASIEIQTMPNLEIICVLDAPTDASELIVKTHAAHDDRYVVVVHAKNSGYGASMNDGISAARGKWIAILEPDDYILPSMYEKLLEAPAEVDTFPELVDVIKSPYVREVRYAGTKRGSVPKELLQCSYRGRIKPRRQPFTMEDAGVAHLLRHHPSIWSALYNAAFLQYWDIRFTEYPGSGWADNEFFYDTLLRARSIVYVDEPFYVYREETKQEFQAFAHNNKMLRFDRWQAMADIIDELGIESESIRAAHIAKGFTYLGEQLAAWDEDDVQIRAGMYAMFARMDPALVAKELMVPANLKEKYFTCMCKDHNAVLGKLGYAAGLAGELAYTWCNNGAEYALDKVKSVLRR